MFSMRGKAKTATGKGERRPQSGRGQRGLVLVLA